MQGGQFYGSIQKVKPDTLVSMRSSSAEGDLHPLPPSGRPPESKALHCRSLKVLVADIDYVMLGMPGVTLSDSALNMAGLPSVKDMLKGSRKAARLFKPEPSAHHAGMS